jgi:signal peptidase II
MMFSRITDFPRMLWLLAVALLITMDQASKSNFSNMIPLEAAVEVTERFNLTHRLNAGAAFSVLSDAGGWQRYFFGLFSAFVVTGISFVCLFRKASPLERSAGAAVVAGGAGNLIDRIQIGAVVDFLDFHLRGLHWPAFNLADVFVVGAVIAWVLLSPKALGQPPSDHTDSKAGR